MADFRTANVDLRSYVQSAQELVQLSELSPNEP